MSKKQSNHTEWQACFEQIYTHANSLIKLSLEISKLIKKAPDKKKVAAFNELFKLYNIIAIGKKVNSDVNLNNFKPYLEENFFKLYNQLLMETTKRPSDSIKDFQDRINTVFTGELQTWTNHFKKIKNNLEKEIEAHEFLQEVKRFFKKCEKFTKKVIPFCLVIGIFILIYKKGLPRF